VRPLNNLDVYFVIGLHIEDARHEDLAQVICLECLEIGIEFSRHGEYLLVENEKGCVSTLPAWSSPLVLVDDVAMVFPYRLDGIGTTLYQAGLRWNVEPEKSPEITFVIFTVTSQRASG
jgi:hypothetical protein